jgi:hypothetical protein
MKTQVLLAVLLTALATSPAFAQTGRGNTSAAPGSSAPAPSGTVKTKSTAKSSKAREKHLQRETRTVQREHNRTENRIDDQNKARIKEAQKAAGTQTR